MPIAQVLRNDDVERFADCFFCAETEDSLAAAISELDDAIAVGNQNAIGGFGKEPCCHVWHVWHVHDVSEINVVDRFGVRPTDDNRDATFLEMVYQ